MSQQKLIVVVGATGNQGGSVALRFLDDPKFRVRGLTRDLSSPKAKALASRGIEMVQADLSDLENLKSVFKGANVIFSVTQYWEPYYRQDCRERAAKLGVSIRRLAYDIEYEAGRCIADAAATTVDSLDDNGFLVSTLSHAAKCSKGAYSDLYHYDAKADIFPDYVSATYPELARKMSCIHTGCFMGSHKLLPNAYLRKLSDGSFRMELTTVPTKPVPHLDVNADTGNFVYAVHQMPPGLAYMAEGTTCPWPEWIAAWSKAVGVPASYKQVSREEMIKSAEDDVDFGIEVTTMFSYMSNPGYDGGMALVTAADMVKAGIECPMTSIDEWMAKQDWSSVLNKPVTYSQ
ncbi:NAD(P)-binding protein [Thozetella sp. PMI_491]|nr:NAD(P)-binding protein [Thozetella sp. PMI_491]